MLMQLTPILLTLTLVTAARADVLDVDPALGPYTEIRDAVAASLSGDVIRVAGGTYESFGVFGKGLRILPAVPAANILVDGSVRIQNLPAGEEAVLVGLTAEASAASGDSGLVVAGCLGAVRVEDCRFVGTGNAGIRVVDSEDVCLTECTGRAFTHTCVDCTSSTLTLFGGEYRGTSFFFTPGFEGMWGITAVTVRDSSLFAQGADISGGWGGDEVGGGLSGCSVPPGGGGHGIFAADSVVRVLGGQILGGGGGDWFWCPPAPGGQRVATSGTTVVTESPGAAVSLEASRSLSAEGAPLLLTSTGDPGDPILLVVGPSTDRIMLPAYTGDLHAGGSLGAVRRALMGPSPAQLQLTMPQLPGFGVEQFWLQAVQLRPGDVVFGSVRSLTVVDSAW